MNDFNASEDYSTIRPAYVAGLERRVEQLTAALETVEWVGLSKLYFVNRMECPWCGNRMSEGHAPDCPREAALSEGRRLTER